MWHSCSTKIVRSRFCVCFMSSLRKKSNYVDKHHNFEGMGDMAEWFIMKDSTNHHENALNWRWCKSNAERTRFVKQNHVRWSELLRLVFWIFGSDPDRISWKSGLDSTRSESEKIISRSSNSISAIFFCWIELVVLVTTKKRSPKSDQ